MSPSLSTAGMPSPATAAISTCHPASVGLRATRKPREYGAAVLATSRTARGRRSVRDAGEADSAAADPLTSGARFDLSGEQLVAIFDEYVAEWRASPSP